MLSINIVFYPTQSIKTKSSCADQFTDTAINDFKHILNTYKQPDTARSRNIGVLLAKTFHEPRYWDSPDSRNLMDLAPTSGDGGRVDWLRARLQKLLPEKFLDASGIDRRELDRKQRSGSMTGMSD